MTAELILSPSSMILLNKFPRNTKNLKLNPYDSGIKKKVCDLTRGGNKCNIDLPKVNEFIINEFVHELKDEDYDLWFVENELHTTIINDQVLRLLCSKGHVRARGSTLWQNRWQEVDEILCTQKPLLDGVEQPKNLLSLTRYWCHIFKFSWLTQQKQTALSAVFGNRASRSLSHWIDSGPIFLRSCLLHWIWYSISFEPTLKWFLRHSLVNICFWNQYDWLLLYTHTLSYLYIHTGIYRYR